MTDIIERLREMSTNSWLWNAPLCGEAADEIGRLRALIVAKDAAIIAAIERAKVDAPQLVQSLRAELVLSKLLDLVG